MNVRFTCASSNLVASVSSVLSSSSVETEGWACVGEGPVASSMDTVGGVRLGDGRVRAWVKVK